ncbi:MAG: hypothetical protein KKH72_01260 [Alphaproteobacteria bacterium]|nr:hypothetical protein [Alphaproteobacteria bacterium]
MNFLRPVLSALLVALALIAPEAATAGQKDIQVLQSYVGSWEGRGTFGTDAEAESIKCRLTVTSAESATVQFNGICALAGGSVNIRGSLGYFETKNRYEATMTSNAAFGGTAIGRRSGSGIDFTMQPTDPDSGANYSVKAGLSLRDDAIVVKASITDSKSGYTSQADVPMKKKS